MRGYLHTSASFQTGFEGTHYGRTVGCAWPTHGRTKQGPRAGPGCTLALSASGAGEPGAEPPARDAPGGVRHFPARCLLPSVARGSLLLERQQTLQPVLRGDGLREGRQQAVASLTSRISERTSMQSTILKCSSRVNTSIDVTKLIISPPDMVFLPFQYALNMSRRYFQTTSGSREHRAEVRAPPDSRTPAFPDSGALRGRGPPATMEEPGLSVAGVRSSHRAVCGYFTD